MPLVAWLRGRTNIDALRSDESSSSMSLPLTFRQPLVAGLVIVIEVPLVRVVVVVVVEEVVVVAVVINRSSSNSNRRRSSSGSSRPLRFLALRLVLRRPSMAFACWDAAKLRRHPDERRAQSASDSACRKLGCTTEA